MRDCVLGHKKPFVYEIIEVNQYARQMKIDSAQPDEQGEVLEQRAYRIQSAIEEDLWMDTR